MTGFSASSNETTARTFPLFVRQHAVWDPMIIWDGRRYLMYVLTMVRVRALDQDSFFTCGNTIHVFESPDLATWRHLGQAIGPRSRQERLCAGSVLFHEERYWFFGSSTIEQCDERHLDQRVFVAVSDDGVNFQDAPIRGLEPDPVLCPHHCFHPVNGRMLFAWRDPWPLINAETGQVHVFICTGGERWGCEPDVALAVADDIRGPYRVLGRVLDLVSEAKNGGFGEIERISVIPVDGGYALTFSCWRRLVDETRIPELSPQLLPLSDSSLYVATSARLEGPYSLSKTCAATVGSSDSTGWYGTTMFRLSGGGLAALGWGFANFCIDPSRTARLHRSKATSAAPLRLMLQWSLRQRVLRRLQTAYSKVLRRLDRLRRRFSLTNHHAAHTDVN